MQKEKHPPYQEVLFVDSSTGYRFVCGSSLQTQKRETFEGKEYPVCYVSVSSASHPFFTGGNKFIDAEGRVDKFLRRYAAAAQKQDKAKEQELAKKAEPVAKKKKR